MMRINLLPKEERGRSKSKVDWSRMAWIGAALLTGIVVLLTVFNVMHVRLTEREEADLFERVSALRIEQSALSRQRSENDEVAQDLDVLERSIFTAQNGATVQLLTAAAEAVPKDGWLDFLGVNSGRGGYLTGQVAETSDLSVLLRRLRAAAGVADVQLETMGPVDGGDGSRREFGVSVTLKEGTP